MSATLLVLRTTVAASLLCLALSSCGGDPPKRSATAPKDAEAREVTVALQAPADGERVRARETKRGAWIAGVDVSGKATAGATVYFRAGCRPDPCLGRARADSQGRFSTRLKVRTRPSVRFVTIDAGPDEVFDGGSDVITVELYGPRTVRAPAGPSKPRENRAREPASRALPRDVLVIGDSLAVGFGQALKEELQGWRVRIDAKISRPLRDGLRILAREDKPPAILAFSLFSNNSPREIAELETAVRATATRSGCAVWATIVRPPFDGKSYEAVNRMLVRIANDAQVALGLQIVDWAGTVAAEPGLLAGDRVHATPGGYGVLAKLYADAIRACAGEEAMRQGPNSDPG